MNEITLIDERMKKILLLLFIALSSNAYGTSPPPGGFKQRSFEELWREADIVVYGIIEKLEVIKQNQEVIGYRAELKPRKQWKGKMNSSYSIFVGLGPTVPSQKFEFMKTYVAFLGGSEDRPSYEAHHSLYHDLVEFVDKPPFQGVFPDRGNARLLEFLATKKEIEIDRDRTPHH